LIKIYQENPVVAHGVFLCPALQDDACRAGPEGTVFQDKPKKIILQGKP